MYVNYISIQLEEKSIKTGNLVGIKKDSKSLIKGERLHCQQTVL